MLSEQSNIVCYWNIHPLFLERAMFVSFVIIALKLPWKTGEALIILQRLLVLALVEELVNGVIWIFIACNWRAFLLQYCREYYKIARGKDTFMQSVKKYFFSMTF